LAKTPELQVDIPQCTGSFETIQRAKNHMDRGGTQKAMKTVATECGIKKGSIHSLRHL